MYVVANWTMENVLTNAIEGRNRLLYGRASSVPEYLGLLRKCGPPTQRQLNVCGDYRTRYGIYLRGLFMDIWAFTYLISLDVREVDRDTLEPILFLLQSADIEVQRAASAALGNLAVNSEPSRARTSEHKLIRNSRKQSLNCPPRRAVTPHTADDVYQR